MSIKGRGRATPVKLLHSAITLINNGVERTLVINDGRACRVICTANSFP